MVFKILFSFIFGMLLGIFPAWGGATLDGLFPQQQSEP
jgi:hypothetical protein